MCARAGVRGCVMITDTLKIRVLTYALCAVAIALHAAFGWGYFAGKSNCELKHAAHNATATATQAQTDLSAVQSQTTQANSAGATLAKAEQSIQTRTQYLTKEVIKYVPTTDAACRSELERVRHVWNAANSGTDPAPATAAERDATVR